MRAEIVIDYLVFTIKGETNAYDVIDSILEMNPQIFQDQAKGLNFYSKSLAHSDIRVLYDGLYGESMGVCVNMSGRGCRAYEDYQGESIIALLKRLIKNPNINITRIDIACDDRSDDENAVVLDLVKIWEYANDSRYRTRLLSRNNQESFRPGQEGAKTIYFGSPSSHYRIRIYDKAKQTGEEGHWVRFEITLKDEYASQAVRIMMDSDNLGKAVSGIIDEKIAFIELDDSNISRCSYASWWVKFLGEIQEVKLTSRQKYKHGIDEHREWLREGCSRIIAKVISAIGADRFSKEVIEYGKMKLSVADEAMIEDYKQREATK